MEINLCSYFFLPNELLLLQVLYEGRPVLRLGEIPRQQGVVEAFLKVTITTQRDQTSTDATAFMILKY